MQLMLLTATGYIQKYIRAIIIYENGGHKLEGELERFYKRAWREEREGHNIAK